MRGDGRVLRNSTSGADWAGAESSAGFDIVEEEAKGLSELGWETHEWGKAGGCRTEDADSRSRRRRAQSQASPHSRDVCYTALTLPLSHSRDARVALLTGTPRVGPRQTSCFCNFQLLRAAGIAASVPVLLNRSARYTTFYRNGLIVRALQRKFRRSLSPRLSSSYWSPTTFPRAA